MIPQFYSAQRGWDLRGSFGDPSDPCPAVSTGIKETHAVFTRHAATYLVEAACVFGRQTFEHVGQIGVAIMGR